MLSGEAFAEAKGADASVYYVCMLHEILSAVSVVDIKGLVIVLYSSAWIEDGLSQNRWC